MIAWGVSAEPLATSKPGRAVGTQVADCTEGRLVAEIVAAEQDRRRTPGGSELAEGLAFVSARRPQLQDKPARLDCQAGSARQFRQRGQESVELGLRLRGPSGVHGDCLALVLDPGAGVSSGGGEHGRQFGAGRGEPWRSGRAGEPTPFPSLHPVVTKDDQLRDLGNARKRGGICRRPAGNDRDRTRQSRQPAKGRHGVRRGPGSAGVVDDRRERAVEVQRDQGPGRLGDQRGEPGPARCRRRLRQTARPADDASPALTMTSVRPG